MVEATKTCLQKYITFSGRASRSEYWFFILAIFLASAVAGVLDAIIFGPQVEFSFKLNQNSSGELNHSVIQNTQYGSGWISDILGILVFVPSIAVGWRRMHDMGRPGWHPLVIMVICVGLISITLFAFLVEVPVPEEARLSMPALPVTMNIPQPPIPLFLVSFFSAFVSMILIIWWLTRPSQSGSNQYGPNPFEAAP